MNLLLYCCLALPLSAQEILETPVGLVEVRPLPCGAQALLQPLGQRPTALTLVLPWGRNHAPTARPGLVEFVARLMARSSPAYPQGTLLLQLEQMGGRTSYRVGERFTSLTLEVPSGYARWALEVQLDRLRGGWLKGEDIEGLSHPPGTGSLEIDTFVLQHQDASRSRLAVVGGFDPVDLRKQLASSFRAQNGSSSASQAPAPCVPPAAGKFRGWDSQGLTPGNWIAAMVASSTLALEPLEDHLWLSADQSLPPATARLWQQAVARWTQSWEPLGSRSLWLAGLHARDPQLLSGLAMSLREQLWNYSLQRFPQDSAFLASPSLQLEGTVMPWLPPGKGRPLKPAQVKTPAPAAVGSPPPFARLEPQAGCSVLVQSLPDLPAVAVRAFLPGGSSLDSPSQAGRAEWLGAYWQELLGQQWWTRVETHPHGWTFSTTLPAGRWQSWLTAWLAAWQEPKLEAALADKAWIERVDQPLLSPRQQAYQEWLKALYPPEHPLGRSELASRPALDRLQELSQEVMRRGRFQLSLSGDVQAPAVQAVFDQSRLVPVDASLPQPWDQLPTRETLVAAPRELKGAQGSATLLLGGYGPSRREPDYYAFVLALQALAGDPLRSRLQAELRWKQGLVSRLESSFLSANSAGPWLLQLDCLPENLPRVQEILQRELQAMGKSQLPRPEWERVVQRLEGMQQVEQGQAEGRLAQLGNLELFHLSDSYTQGFANIYRNITPKDVMLVARRRFQPDRLVRVQLVP